MVFRIGVVLSLWIGFAADAEAEPLDGFRERVAAAFSSGDSDSVESLYYLLPLSAEDRERTRGLIERHLTDLEVDSVAFAEPPPTENQVQVLDGYEYRPAIPIAGRVVLGLAEGRTMQIPYGEAEDRFWLVGQVRERVKPGMTDQMLQMIAVGVAHPPFRFTGYCDIRLSNRETRRLSFDDEGRGNQTRAHRGQFIETCELRALSDYGTLSLRLLEGDKEIFSERIELPRRIIRYRR